MSKGRPGISFKLNPPKTKEPKFRVPIRRKVKGMCDWCKAKGSDLVRNQYGTFHVDGRSKCFMQFFFLRQKAERDADQTQ